MKNQQFHINYHGTIVSVKNLKKLHPHLPTVEEVNNLIGLWRKQKNPKDRVPIIIDIQKENYAEVLQELRKLSCSRVSLRSFNMYLSGIITPITKFRLKDEVKSSRDTVQD